MNAQIITQPQSEHTGNRFIAMDNVKAFDLVNGNFVNFDALIQRSSADLNIDYRVFRSKPFVRFKKPGEYAVINIQLLCERVFNSLNFDLMPLINRHKSSVGFFDFNKEFVEKYLHKGTKICLNGRIQTGSYTNKDGQKVYTTDVVVEDQEFAESKNQGNGDGGFSNNAPASFNPSNAATDGFMDLPGGAEEDMTFH